MKKLMKLLSDESGATAVEYGLLAALISVGLIAGVGTFSNALNDNFTLLSTKIAPK